MSDPKYFGYEAMGTHWAVSAWDAMTDAAFADLERDILAMSREFDATYSRFKPTSLVSALSRTTGRVDVPEDLVAMLRLYARLNALSGGACNPLVGATLSDLGYDAEYSLTQKSHVRPPADFSKTVRILDDRTIELAEPVQLDLGGLGKGYFVDKISAFLDEKGLRRFLVDGSGDIFYRGDGHPLRAGLEHPDDPAKAIGVVTITEGSLCASSGNRRKWSGIHHIIDPNTLRPPEHLLAAWVLADTAAVADGLTTCVFLTEPERYAEAFAFEYCLLNDEYKVKRSEGFLAEFF